MAEIRESDVYAALGMEVPGQTPGAATPAVAGEGANEPGPAAPERAGGQNDASPAGSGRTDPSTAYGGPPPHDRGGFGGASKGAAPAEDGRTDPSASRADVGIGPYGARNDGTGDGGDGFLGSARNDGTGDGGDSSTACGGPPPLGRGGFGGTSKGAAPAETEAEDAAPDPKKEQAPVQSRAERAEQARLRRERETQEKIDAAVARALEAERSRQAEELKGIFAKAGMTDRYNGNRPITSKEEFDAWQDRARTERLSRQLRDGSLTPEAFQEAVDASPTVRAAKDFMDRMEAAEQERKDRETEARFKEQVAAELTEIRKLNPGVKSLEDILRMETGPRFAQLVRERGMSYLEAFQLANMDDILKAGSMAAAEGAARQQHSKDHLRSSAGVGAVPREVPRAVVMQYRELFPDWTMEQIRADYIKRMQ